MRDVIFSIDFFLHIFRSKENLTWDSIDEGLDTENYKKSQVPAIKLYLQKIDLVITKETVFIN